MYIYIYNKYSTAESIVIQDYKYSLTSQAMYA